jgi:hypothetical protein
VVERHNRGRERPEGEEVDIYPGSLAGEGIVLYQQPGEDLDGSHHIHEGEHQEEEARIHDNHEEKEVYACPSFGEEVEGSHSGHREVAFEAESRHGAHPEADNLFECGQSEVVHSLNVLAVQN